MYVKYDKVCILFLPTLHVLVMFLLMEQEVFMTKRYINVSYNDRDMAKRLGARWDASVKRWYCPDGSNLSKIFAWRQAMVEDASVQSQRAVPPSARRAMVNRSQFSELPLFAGT